MHKAHLAFAEACTIARYTVTISATAALRLFLWEVPLADATPV